MGVRTDVVICDPDEVHALVESDAPASDRDGFTFNGFDFVPLCTLLSLLRAGGPYTEFERYLERIEVVGAASGDWPVVSVVAPELASEVAAVAGLEAAEFEALAAAWAETEEFAGWTDADVRQLLRELGDLAESASLQDKCLVIWKSM